MNTAIEIHDSRVGGIEEVDGLVIVHFLPAYLHQSKGRPGVDSGTGWVQEARLIFTDASVSGNLPAWPCDSMSGEMITGCERHDNSIPVPLEATKLTELRLTCDSVHSVTIIGQSIKLELIGEPRYVEDFPGHKPCA